MKCVSFVRQLIDTAFQHADVGIAFNAMAKHVDWEREDLFHLPLDVLAVFLCQKLSRHFVIRNDYGCMNSQPMFIAELQVGADSIRVPGLHEQRFLLTGEREVESAGAEESIGGSDGHDFEDIAILASSTHRSTRLRPIPSP